MTDRLRDRAAAVTPGAPERLSRGVRPVDRYRLALPGAEGAHEREVLVSRHVVAVVPYDPVTDEIVLIRQFRLAAHLRTGLGDMVEVPAGGVDPGEPIEAAARRELLEETGLVARRMRRALAAMPTPGSSTEIYDLFVAEVEARAAGATAGLEHEGEVIAPLVVPATAAIRAARAGHFVNGFALLSLLWFGSARTRVRANWRQVQGTIGRE